MKRLTLPFVFAMTVLAQPGGPRSVYVLPMAGGLDQYLAARIAHEHVMQVVADPKLADALMTDRLGDASEKTREKFHPRDDDRDDAESPHHSSRPSGTRGTFFLGDAKSRHVIWSDFEKPPRSV